MNETEKRQVIRDKKLKIMKYEILDILKNSKIENGLKLNLIYDIINK